MNLLNKTHALAHVLKWRLTWDKYDLDYESSNVNNLKFVSARKAAGLIKDSDVCISSGMAGNGRCSIFYWAIRDSYLTNNHPKNLTWVSVSAQGGRGKAPGTVEELDPPGLVDKYLSGHVETAKSLLKSAEEGNIELHTFPQGEMVYLLEAQARGEETIDSKTGVGTFLDPRAGSGSSITPNPTQEYITVSEKDSEKLSYRLPKIDVAVFSAPYADREGNIYYQDAAVITENTESALAAHKNGGKVIVAVSGIIEKNEKEISLPAHIVDAIVVNPWNEQTASIKQKKFWNMFTKGAEVDEKDAIDKLRMVNRLMGITPKRGIVENALSRMATSLFVKEVEKDSLINFGIGLPEEVGRHLLEGGLYKDIICSSETGVYNGLPTPGAYFGGAINPKKILSSIWMYNHYKENLDVAVLGLMQVDSEGNVNVSKRGSRVSDYVGPGGFINITSSAKTIIFIGSWMAKAKMVIKDGAMRIKEPGIVKFVDKVDQVTFSGKQALKKGKRVFYVTNVGIFKLTKRGLELIQVTPGINIQRDIVERSNARIIIPRGKSIPVVPHDVMTGIGFKPGF